MSEKMETGNDMIKGILFPVFSLNEEQEVVYYVQDDLGEDEVEPVQDIITQEPTTENTTTEDSEVAMTIGTPYETGITYAMEDLMDFEFLVSNCYIVTSSTSVNPEELDANVLLNMDLSVDTSSDDYKVLIYHTHGSETYLDSREGVTEDTVIGVGDELASILEEDYGIKVYHDTNVYDMVDGKLDRSYAYDLSGAAVDEILAKYPSIEVVIDLHRDGVNGDVHLVTDVDGRPTAKIMFVNGVSRLNVNGEIEELNNPNKIGNLAFSLQMLLEGKRLYGDFMRNIYVTGYCYNLDRLPRAALVEVGAQTNTVEEAKNAMIPLAAIIYSVLSEK
ncbi:MAG: stage II sporulation protein P, partial [Lachnospiraceae bacterium]|nr:stage II sporulation protein P [Lachnospiraceae bacterium]